MARERRRGRYTRNRQEIQPDRGSLADQQLVSARRERELLSKLEKFRKRGADLETIYRELESEIAARLIEIGLVANDDKTALAALKEVTDRVKGRAKETITQVHQYDRMSENELDALLKSKLAGTGSGGGRDE